MNIVKPNAELMKHDTDLYSFIEKVGRICYKSEDKITKGSAKKFVAQLVSNKHYAMTEHEYIYVHFSNYNDIIQFISGYLVPDSHSYTIHKYLNISEEYISGSVRAWIEFFDEVYKISKVFDIGKGIYEEIYEKLYKQYSDLFPIYDKYENWDFFAKDKKDGGAIGEISIVSRQEFLNADLPSYVYFNLLPHTIKFTVDRGVSHELVRHRPASFAQSSTRYCDYSKGKYGSELSFIEPCFFENVDEDTNWYKVCKTAEDAYLDMRDNKIPPEQARSILPNSLMTEIVVTATEAEWQHIINLREHGTTGRPHPQMKEVMDIAYPILQTESWGRIK